MKVALLVAAAMLATAGCAGTPTPGGLPATEQATANEVRLNATTGAIRGVAVDSEEKPIKNVLVGLDEGARLRTTNSSLDGGFVFNDVEPGPHRIYSQAVGYQATGVKVNVLAGEVSEVRLVLRALQEAPAFPVEARLDGVETVGGWFQIPYAEAAKFLPDGFTAKPHVLLESNGETAEYGVYVTKYRNGTIGGVPIGEGYWTFHVLSVDPTSEHGSGATVDFILLGSQASEPRLIELLGFWRLPTDAAQITYARTAAGDANQVTAATRSAKTSIQLTAADAGEQSTLTAGALSVRYFGLDGNKVVNYVDVRVASVLYSITGGARIDSSTGLPVAPLAPAGEGYIQWGATTNQILTFVKAKAPRPA